ncbi:MAG: hypoxanthine phosphoribosyltransferase, partial [Blastocatellia bacterium]|nr:hypoxanthine phosphoribosyltransferase [Blastocatellia bacterium]
MSPEPKPSKKTEFTNDNLEVLYSADVIRGRIREMGAEITREYNGKDLVLVGVLKGSCVFLADLMREIDLPLTIDFMSVSSYKDGTKSTGDVEIIKDLSNNIRDKHVLIVEDIVDTG